MLIIEALADLGYDVLEAPDGPTAMELLAQGRRIDLLVTDVGLPGMNGRQLGDALRTTPPGLKVVFITGYAENAVLNYDHLEAGMQIITKPFTMEVLASRIKALLS